MRKCVHSCTCLAAAWLASAALSGQGLVIPSQAPQRDAVGVPEPFPGAYARLRQQFVFGASWLGSLQRRTLVGVSFKRDGFLTKAMPGGQAQVRVRVSSLAVAPERVSPVFAANHGAVVDQVFQGTLTFPNSPALPDRDAADWSALHSFRIDFVPPVPYRGGSLCLEIEGEPVAGSVAERWRIDYQAASTQGTVTHAGNGCGVVRGVVNQMAWVDPRELHAGASPRFLAFAEPASASAVAIAPLLLTQPVNLDFLGAPSCWAYVNPVVTLPSGLAAGAPARVQTTLPFPGDAIFAGMQLYLQWVHVAAGSLSTSEALGVTLAASLPGLDAAVVTSARADGLAAMPSSGYVSASKMPVLQLHVQ